MTVGLQRRPIRGERSSDLAVVKTPRVKLVGAQYNTVAAIVRILVLWWRTRKGRLVAAAGKEEEEEWWCTDARRR